MTHTTVAHALRTCFAWLPGRNVMTRIIALVALAVAAATLALAQQGDPYPSRPVKIVIGFGAGAVSLHGQNACEPSAASQNDVTGSAPAV